MTLHQHLQKSLSTLLHKLCFEESFSPVFDSIFDEYEQHSCQARDSNDYIDKMNHRRRRLGVSPLAQSGKLPDSSSLHLTEEWARHLLKILEPEHKYKLSLSLYYQDPAGTNCLANDCNDEYDLVAFNIATESATGRPFSEALENSLKQSFGVDSFTNISFEMLLDDVIDSMTLKLVRAFSASTGSDPRVSNILADMEQIQLRKTDTDNLRAVVDYEHLHLQLDRMAYIGIRPCRALYPNDIDQE